MLRFVIFALAAPMLYGSNLSRSIAVCLDDRVHIGSRAQHAFSEELRLLLSGSALLLSTENCSETVSIRISIRSHAPARYQTALGLAFIASGRVLPMLELYTTNVLRTLDKHAGAELFGRALARVAFHEIRHYVRQERDHEGAGLFTASLTGAQLLTSGHRH